MDYHSIGYDMLWIVLWMILVVNYYTHSYGCCDTGCNSLQSQKSATHNQLLGDLKAKNQHGWLVHWVLL